MECKVATGILTLTFLFMIMVAHFKDELQDSFGTAGCQLSGFDSICTLSNSLFQYKWFSMNFPERPLIVYYQD